uniref:Tudor domain-containing protein n=2 Tax=Caenorhabditis japonica TaxID=281687 RepID=A0A8R1I7M7_CAEJA
MTDGTSSAAKFMSSVNGLVPSTIFDRVHDMDVSEEMEEIREVLYEMIKKNFSMGVAATHLAEKYHEEFVSKGLGRELPDDWIQQVTAAEEFEAQTRGPITILFVRLSNTSSFKRPPINSVNVRVISTDREPTADELKKIKQRKENEPLEHAKTLSRQSPALKQGSTVSIVFADSPRRFFIRALADDDQYEKIGTTLAEIYGQETPPSPLDSRVAIYEIVAGGAYALQDSNGTWFRVIASQPPQSGQVMCQFVDVGVCEKFPVAAIRLLPPTVHPVMSLGAMAREVRLDVTEDQALKFNLKFIDLVFETKDGVQVPANLTVGTANKNIYRKYCNISPPVLEAHL